MPNPATPLAELIAQNVLATVQSVVPANGYNFALTAQRHSRGGDLEKHLNAIIVQEDPREVPDPKMPNTRQWLLEFGIGVYLMPAETDATPIDQTINLIASDVTIALMKDRYRGANALDTKILPLKTDVAADLRYEIALIGCEVMYRTSELDPTVRA